MNRICLFVFSGVLAGCAHSTADTMTSQFTAGETVVVDNPGRVTVAGVPPAEALGAIDTRRVTTTPAVTNGGETSAEPPPATANGSIAVEGAQPAAVLGAIDPKKLVDEKPE